MALDVKLVTVDAGVPDLDRTVIFRNTKYDIAGDRGITTYPLKILKVFQRFFGTTLGSYAIPPVIALDWGTTIEVFNVECILRGTGADPLSNVEAQIQDLRAFFKGNTMLANHVFLYIGDELSTIDYAINPDFSIKEILFSGPGIEGKVGKYKFKWISKEFAIVKLTFDFYQCIDLDVF